MLGCEPDWIALRTAWSSVSDRMREPRLASRLSMLGMGVGLAADPCWYLKEELVETHNKSRLHHLTLALS